MVKQEGKKYRKKVSEYISEQSSEAKQAGAKLTHNAIMPSVVTTRDKATIMYNNRSQCNYTWTELATER